MRLSNILFGVAGPHFKENRIKCSDYQNVYAFHFHSTHFRSPGVSLLRHHVLGCHFDVDQWILLMSWKRQLKHFLAPTDESFRHSINSYLVNESSNGFHLRPHFPNISGALLINCFEETKQTMQCTLQNVHSYWMGRVVRLLFIASAHVSIKETFRSPKIVPP